MLFYRLDQSQIIQPSIKSAVKMYENSIKNLGLCNKNFEIRSNPDQWKSPSIGASGVGWEVIINKIETGQITYFNKMGDIKTPNSMLEITYGIERIAMCLNNTFNIEMQIFPQ